VERNVDDPSNLVSRWNAQLRIHIRKCECAVQICKWLCLKPLVRTTGSSLHKCILLC